MGFASPGQTSQGHRPGMPRGLCPIHHGEEAGHVRALKPRPEGEDEENRLSPPGRQGEKRNKGDLSSQNSLSIFFSDLYAPIIL